MMEINQPHYKIYYKLIDQNGRDTPWLTMIHGFSHSHHYFSAQIRIFSNNFRLFLADLRGHGQSAAAKGPYGIEEYTDDIIAALDDAGIEKTHYWGTHTGAAIGLVLALRHPDRLASLVLEGTYLPGFDMPRVDELLTRARTLAQTKGVQPALEDWFEAADWFDFIREHPQKCRSIEHKQMVFEFQGKPWLSTKPAKQVTPAADQLAAIQHPTFIYNGEHDMPDFMRAAAKLHTDLPNAQRAVILEAGGFPGWENPQEVHDLVLKFLKKCT
jgi:pimeloyl-ACP methyl ester carboxylesterase